MQDTRVLPLQPSHTMSSWSSLCAQGHRHAGTGFSLLVPVKGNCNATAHKDTVYNCVLRTLWQQFGERAHMAVMVRCPHAFSHIVYSVHI